MKVYVVTILVETEYGGRANDAIFDSKEKAEAYVNAHQEIEHCWYGDENLYEIEVWGVL